MSTDATPEPADYTDGLGLMFRAFRTYIGIDQWEMARRLGKDRRDYQRIEKGRDSCPPGLVTAAKALMDEFDNHVDLVLAHAKEADGLVIEVSNAVEHEWERAVAFRAAVLASDHGGAISLTMVGN